MQLRIGRIVIAAIAAEVLGVLALVVIVTIFGPSGGFEAAQSFAERLGAWVGPISGFVLCLAGGYWVARGAPTARIQNGAAMGVAAAVLDVAIAVGFGGSFQLLLVVSNAGRVVAGTIGGWLASRPT